MTHVNWVGVLGLLTVLSAGFQLGANPVSASGCGNPQAQVCNPGQYADTSGNETVCRACTGNTVSDGCSNRCSVCGDGAKPNADHSQCEAPTIAELLAQIKAQAAQLDSLRAELKGFEKTLPAANVLGSCGSMGYINAGSLPDNPAALVVTVYGCH